MDSHFLNEEQAQASLVGLGCFNECTWHPPTQRPTLTVSHLFN